MMRASFRCPTAAAAASAATGATEHVHPITGPPQMPFDPSAATVAPISCRRCSSLRIQFYSRSHGRNTSVSIYAGATPEKPLQEVVARVPGVRDAFGEACPSIRRGRTKRGVTHWLGAFILSVTAA